MELGKIVKAKIFSVTKHHGANPRLEVTLAITVTQPKE